MAAMATIVTDTGVQVPELTLRPNHIIDRTTVIYGPSGTGKSIAVKHIMMLTRGHIEQILVVSPTEPSNHSYEGFVDATLIHPRMYIPDPKDKRDTDQKSALRFLETVFKRQEMMASLYNRANNMNTLTSLYSKLPHAERKKSDDKIASLERKRRRALEAVKQQCSRDEGLLASKTKKVDEQFERMLGLLYKKFLTPHVESLWKSKKLTEDERYSLQYLHFNPRLLLIFDDCAAELKQFFNRDVFRKLFYQNRHLFLTVLICCQDDTDLPANLRKNAYISVFTSPIVASANFDRPANKFPKSTKEYIMSILADVFVGHRKLIYIREDETQKCFYHYTFKVHKPAMFGSPVMQELCNAVRSEGAVMDKNNPFFDKFKIDDQ